MCLVSLAWVLGLEELEPSLIEVPQVGLLGVPGIWVLRSKWQMVGQGSGPHVSHIHQSNLSSAANGDGVGWGALTSQSMIPER